MLDRFSRNAIFFSIDTDKPEGKALRKEYALKGIPTAVVLSPKGREVDRIIGYDGRSTWLKTLLGYLYGVDTLQDYLDRDAAKPDPELELAIARKYLDKGEAENALIWEGKARKGGLEGDSLLDLDLLRGEAWLKTDPPKGIAALTAMASSGKNPKAKEAFDAVSYHYRRQAKAAKEPEDKKRAQEAMLSLYHEVMPAFGNDPEFLNGYAWHCAEEGLELDRALEAAKKAVELSKQDPGILDTLAEVYYKRGEKADAVKTIELAIAQKPDEKYYREQREKFLGGGAEH